MSSSPTARARRRAGCPSKSDIGLVGQDIREWWPGIGWVSAREACRRLDADFDAYFARNKLKYHHLAINSRELDMRDYRIPSRRPARRPMEETMVERVAARHGHFDKLGCPSLI